jgi:hypothetical protein
MTVREELTTRVVALSTQLSIPVAYENFPFSKPANHGSFMEMTINPFNIMDATVDGTRRRETGFMQINVYCQSGLGTKQGDDLTQAIVDAFPLLPKQGSVSIENTPSIKPAFIDESGYRIIPVYIQYRRES